MISGLRISGVMQVQLDVVIAYVNRTKARSLGFNFNGSNNRNYFLGQQIGNVGPTPSFGATDTPPLQFHCYKAQRGDRYSADRVHLHWCCER